MDDEEVVLDFVADVTEAVAGVDELRDATQELAVTTEEAKAGLDGIRDGSVEAGAASDGLRDRLAEAAAAAGMYRDEMGRLRDAQGRFVAQSTLEDLALGHTRDEALEAAAAFRALKDEKKKAADAGMLSGLFASSGLLGSGGLGSKIPMGGGLFSLPALLAIVPAVEALLPEILGLVSGFAAAGAGAAGFALLAMPAFKSVSGAYQQIQTDQQAYNRALTATARNTALQHLKADYAGLSGPQRDAVQGIQGLAAEWHKLSDAFTPEAFKVFNGFLHLADEVLPDVTPFAKTFADAISGLLGKAGQFAGSTGFKDWLNQFHQLEGPSITAIGDGIGKVANSIGKLLTVMSSKDVVNAINIAFGILSGTIQIVTYMVKRLMDNWDGMSVAVKHSWYDIKRWTDDVTHVFDVLRHAAAEFGHDWAHYFDDVRHTIASWAGDVKTDTGRVVSWFTRLPGEIMRVLESLPGRLVQFGRDIVQGLINGVESMAGTLASAIESLIPSPIRSIVSGVLGIFSPSTVFHGYGVNIVQGLINGVRSMQPHLRTAMQELTGGITGTGSALAAGALAPAGSTSVHVNIPVTATGTAGNVFQSPQYQQALQAAVQEVTLRYAQLNPTNGLTPAWGR